MNIKLIPLVFLCLGLSCNNLRSTPKDVRPAANTKIVSEEGVDLPIGNSPVRGKKDAPVTIVMFSDLQCPYCNEGRKVMDEVYEKYQDKVRIVWKNLPLMEIHPNALPGAVAGMAIAKQNDAAFWTFQETLFTRMAEFSGRGAPQLAPIDFEKFLPQTKNLNLEAWRNDVKNEKQGEKFVKDVFEDMELAQKVGAQATPTFFLNGRKIEGALPLEVFSQLIDKEIEETNKLLAKGVKAEALYKTRLEKNLITADTRFQVKPEGPSLGPKDAKITIIAFSEYQCPYCIVGDDSINQLREKYPDDIRVVYRNLPLVEIHPDALLAAEAALAAHEQGKFAEYHQKLFANQRIEDPDNPGKMKSGITPADLERFAKEIGLDMKPFQAALEDHRFQEKIITDVRAAISFGIQGTPAYFVNGKVFKGAVPFEAFEEIVKAEMQEVDKILAKGVAREDLYQEIIKDGYVP